MQANSEWHVNRHIVNVSRNQYGTNAFCQDLAKKKMKISLQFNHCQLMMQSKRALLEVAGDWQKNTHGVDSSRVPLLYTVVLACRLSKTKELSSWTHASMVTGNRWFSFFEDLKINGTLMPLGQNSLQKHVVWSRTGNLTHTSFTQKRQAICVWGR